MSGNELARESGYGLVKVFWGVIGGAKPAEIALTILAGVGDGAAGCNQCRWVVRPGLIGLDMGWDWSAIIVFISTLVAGTLGGRLLRGLISSAAIRTGVFSIPSTTPSESFELAGESSIVFEALKRELESSTSFKLNEVNNADRRLFLSTGLTLHSWGELIDVEFRQIDSGRFVVTLSSRPKLSGVKFDGGKNKKNLDAIEGLIRKQNLA